MKKSVLFISCLFLLALVGLTNRSTAQGLMVPGGTGAWGNMIYGGVGLTTPQAYYDKYPGIDKTKMLGSFGVGLGDPVKLLGFQIGSSMMDISQHDMYNLGLKVHKYFGEGLSVAVGIEDLFTFGSSTQASSGYSSEYIALTKDLRYNFVPQSIMSKVSYSLGVGVGRFSELSQYDVKDKNRKNGTYVFGGLQYHIDKRFSLHADWTGTNLDAGLSFNSFVEKVPFTIILGAADLTPYSGNGVRFIGAVGFAYQIKDNRDAEREQEMKDAIKKSKDDMCLKIDQTKDELDKKIKLLEEEIKNLKEKQKGMPSSFNPNSSTNDDYASSMSNAGGADNDKNKVKNFKNDIIVKVDTSLTGTGSTNTRVEHGYYVIIHSFRQKEMAENSVRLEKQKGVEANIVYNQNRKWYYIYTNMYKNLKEALAKSTEQREKGYEGAWVHIY